MSWLKKFKPTPALLAVVVVAVLVGGGSATASSLITSKQIKNGTIQKADLSKKAIKSLSGKAGPAGPAGAAGATGAAATNLWGVVSATATPTLARGKGVVSVSPISTGLYWVKFDRDISQCAWQVTTGSINGASADNTRATVEMKSASDVDSLYVKVYNLTTDTLTDSSTSRGFHVSVFC